MNCARRSRRLLGFTLIELLVVIAVIVILLGILFPVFKGAREKARQAKCISNLHALTQALRAYRMDEKRYPGPPQLDPTGSVYIGGVSDLVGGGYVSSKEILICPDDIDALGNLEACKNRNYSSYNGLVTDMAGGDWSLAERYYNYYGYDEDGIDYDPAVAWPENGQTLSNWAPWLTEDGKTRKDYPRLRNRYAPDNTIWIHCRHHRRFYSTKPDGQDENKKREIIARLGGSVDSFTLSELTTPNVTTSDSRQWNTFQHQRQ